MLRSVPERLTRPRPTPTIRRHARRAAGAPPRSAGGAREPRRRAGRVPARGAGPRAAADAPRLRAAGAAPHPRRRVHRARRPPRRGRSARRPRALRRRGPFPALPLRKRGWVPGLRARPLHGAGARRRTARTRRAARRPLPLRSGARVRPEPRAVHARVRRARERACAVARAPRRPRTRLGRAARGGAARAAPPPRALPGRRPPHPRLPGRGRRLPGEPDAALRGAARGARVGALHRARAPPPGAARRLPRRGPGLPPRQLAGALPPPPRRAGRDGPARRVHRRLRPLPPERRPGARPRHPDRGRGRWRGPLPRRRRHRGRLGPRARARRGVAQDGRAAPRPRRGSAPRAGAVLVWLNGRFLPARDARVSALDRGLLHGDGVYDTWRTYGGVPFATAAHLRRLAAAARALGLPAPGAVSVWERRVHRLVARCGLADAAVRLTVTRGTAGEGLVPEGRARPTLLLTARRLPTHLGPRQAPGVPVALLPFPRDAGPPWGGLKLVGHPSAVVGRVTASRRGAAEGLYVTAAAEVTEATSANLFLVERGALVTPPRAAGILPGVTRALVIALARRAGLRVREERVSAARLRRAREIFLTASTIELLPVVRLDGRAVGGGRAGPVTLRLQSAYAGHVAAALRRAR